MYSRKAVASCPSRESSPFDGIVDGGAEAFQPANEDGRIPCAAAGCAAMAKQNSPRQTQTSRRITPLDLDTESLLRVPGSRYSSGVVVGCGASLLLGGEAVGALQVAFNSLVKPFGNPLAILGLLEPLLVARVRKKGNFSEYGWHIGADQHDERCLADAAAAVATAV